MADGPANTELRSETTAMLRERLQRFADQLDALDDDQLAVMHELVLLLEHLASLPDTDPKH